LIHIKIDPLQNRTAIAAFWEGQPSRFDATTVWVRWPAGADDIGKDAGVDL